MTVFPLLAGASLWFRKSPATHKRLMLLANALIVSVGYARWWGEAITKVVGDGHVGMLLSTYAGFYLITAAAMAYDLATLGRIHYAYLIGAPLIVTSQVTVSVICHAAEWRPIARWIAGI
jgi:hypothetical protein